MAEISDAFLEKMIGREMLIATNVTSNVNYASLLL